MQILITVALTAVAAIQTPSSAPRVTRSESVLVRSVVDGETIDVAAVGHVRLLGIDAPSAFAHEARERLTQLVLHRWVRLEWEGSITAHGRRPAYVLTEDGVCVNAALLRDGVARLAARGGSSRQVELQRAEAEARSFRRGIWADSAQQPMPSYTRRATAPRPPTSRTKTPAPKRRTTRTKKP